MVPLSVPCKPFPAGRTFVITRQDSGLVTYQVVVSGAFRDQGVVCSSGQEAISRLASLPSPTPCNGLSTFLIYESSYRLPLPTKPSPCSSPSNPSSSSVPSSALLFPEFCPDARAAGEFGNQEEFTVPNRVQKHLKEPTVSVTAIGKVIAGYHYEVVKDSDLVDKENIKTEGGRRNTIEHFKYMWPLVERNKGQYGWRDTEGTRYDFSDTYGTEIIEKEEGLPEKKRTWHQEVRGCFDEEGNVLWPSRWTKELLEDEENSMGPTLFAAQYLNQPVPDSGGLAGPKDIVFFPRKALSGIALRLHATIDLHGGEANVGNDYTVINVSGFDNDGRMYLVDLRVGHFTPFETIDHIFEIHKKHRGIDFKIEKDAHARILLPFLKREMSKRGTWPLMVPIKRDSRISKKQRIMGLQAWFRAGNIRILEDISHRLEIIQQITRFSLTSHYHDDILDTMADHLQNSDGGVSFDVMPRGKQPVQFEHFIDKFQGFGPDGAQIWYLDPPPSISGRKWEKTGL